MSTDAVTSLRQRMIEDMNARKLGAHSQRSHISSCKRFAAFLKRSPDSATPDDVRRFQLHLAESGISICNRNRIMTGVKFLFRVTLRRLDLAAESYHLREPQKIPRVMSPDETRRVLAVATSLKARAALSLCYGCGLRAGEVVRLKVKHIDSAQKIIRIEQSKGRKDRNVMLSPEKRIVALLGCASYRLLTFFRVSRNASRKEKKISTPYPTKNAIASGDKEIDWVKLVKRPTTRPAITAAGKRA
jgi:integrase